MLYLRKISLLIILLTLTFSQLWAVTVVFDGNVNDKADLSPVPFYPVYIMLNNNTSNCIQTLTDDNGYYNAELEVNLNDFDTTFVRVFDCMGVEHFTYFTAFNSVNSADFLICVEFNNCQAQFIADEDIDNPLAYFFTNISIGNYNSVLWDFGDGTGSKEENPYHVFAQEGVYEVSLIIIDSLNPDGCFDYISLPVYVGGAQKCVANFSITLDTLNNTPLVYHFINESTGNGLSYLWNFGDGEVSDEENPQHIYYEGGEYYVSLMIIDTSNDCLDEISQHVLTPNYYDFGGQVFLGNFPINLEPDDHENSATAYLYRKVENRWYYMDKREFWQLGYYWFTNKLEGDYLIRVDLDKNSEAYDQYAPGYYKHSAKWQNANAFTLQSEVFEESINLVELTAIDNGIYQISGSVIVDSSQELMQGALVQLYDQNKNFVRFTYSDYQGYYEFDNLPDGLYYVKGEVVGVCSSEPNVSLSSDNSAVNDVDVNLFNCGAIGIDENKDGTTLVALEIFPIPASKSLTIQLNSVDNISGELSVVNVQGKIISNYPIKVTPQETFQLDVSSWPNGIYLVNLLENSKNQLISKKIIISH
jgi:PKD repeat protein